MGQKTFQFTFKTSVNKLHIIIGASVGAFSAFLVSSIAFIIWKRRRGMGLKLLKVK